MTTTTWHHNSHERGCDGRRQTIERCINVPSVEPGRQQIIFGRDDTTVKAPVVRVLIFQSLILFHEAVTNYLHPRLVGNGLEVPPC